MNITDKATKVLAEIEARLTHPECGIEEQRALRCLKTAIEGELLHYSNDQGFRKLDTGAAEHRAIAANILTTLCDQWEKSQAALWEDKL